MPGRRPRIALAGHLLFLPPTRFSASRKWLGVFAPAASCLLPELIGRRARSTCCCPAAVSPAPRRSRWAREGIGSGARAAALAYFDEYLEPKSAYRCAMRCAPRGSTRRRIKAKLAAVEHLYLEELMATRDAVEGLQAFLSKRPAQWEHR